jgi:hypothetical protein
MKTTAACLAAALCALPQAAFASGHGPVFGATTPTLGKGGWSLDTAWTMRAGEPEGSEQMLKSIITENLQLSASLPTRRRQCSPAARRSRPPGAEIDSQPTAEDRQQDRVGGVGQPTGARSVFVGPTTLILYKAFAFEAGVLFPAYQHVDAGRTKERLRVAANVSYFFWLK